jgi:transposase InsO family protein
MTPICRLSLSRFDGQTGRRLKNTDKNEAARANLNRHPPQGLIHQSDRGVQYSSREILQALGSRGLNRFLSRKANCYDDAVIESFWITLQNESTARSHFKTRAQARLAVFDFVECYLGGWAAASGTALVSRSVCC